MKAYKLKYILILLTTSVMLLSSCEKMLEIKPDNLLLAEDAVKTPEDLQKLLNSCYDALADKYNGRVQTYNDLKTDDLEKPFSDGNGFKTQIWNRTSNFFNSDIGSLYNELYIPVYRVNSMDQYYDIIPGLTDADKQRIKAEGRFIRAVCHFEVVKLWAKPYGFTSDNSHPGIPIRDKASQDPLPRATVAAVYDFIIADLEYAIANLPSVNGNYADINAAKGVLADVYFNMNKLAECKVLLDELINSNTYILSSEVDRYNSDPTAIKSEFIFSFVSNGVGDNRGDEFIGQYRSDTRAPNYGISKNLYDLISSDTTDVRNNLIGVVNEGQSNEYYVTKKFNADFFGCPYVTLTKLLLMRAEINALSGDKNQAVLDINKIIERAYPGNTNKLASLVLSDADLVLLVREERRKELFCEGDRASYLLRFGAFYDDNTTIRGADWKCEGLSLQFPSTEGSSVFVFNGTGGCE